MAALTAFATALGRVTLALVRLGQGLANLTVRAGGAAVGAAASAPGSFASALANNNFLMRRVSWAAYHVGTAGTDALWAGAARAFNSGSLGGFGQAFSRGVTTNILQQLDDKLGFNFGQIRETTSAGKYTSDITSEIARAGGKIDPRDREALFKFRLEGERRAEREKQQVLDLVQAQYSKDTTTFNEDSLNATSRLMLDVLTDIRNDIRKLSGG